MANLDLYAPCCGLIVRMVMVHLFLWKANIPRLTFLKRASLPFFWISRRIAL